MVEPAHGKRFPNARRILATGFYVLFILVTIFLPRGVVGQQASLWRGARNKGKS